MFTLRLLFSSTRNMMLKKMIIQKLTNYKQNFLISQFFSSHWKLDGLFWGKPLIIKRLGSPFCIWLTDKRLGSYFFLAGLYDTVAERLIIFHM